MRRWDVRSRSDRVVLWLQLIFVTSALPKDDLRCVLNDSGREERRAVVVEALASSIDPGTLVTAVSEGMFRTGAGFIAEELAGWLIVVTDVEPGVVEAVLRIVETFRQVLAPVEALSFRHVRDNGTAVLFDEFPRDAQNVDAIDRGLDGFQMGQRDVLLGAPEVSVLMVVAQERFVRSRAIVLAERSTSFKTLAGTTIEAGIVRRRLEVTLDHWTLNSRSIVPPAGVDSGTTDQTLQALLARLEPVGHQMFHRFRRNFQIFSTLVQRPTERLFLVRKVRFFHFRRWWRRLEVRRGGRRQSDNQKSSPQFH